MNAYNSIGGGGAGGRVTFFSTNYFFTGTYTAYGGYRIDTYDFITEQAGPGTFYFFIKKSGLPYVQALLVSEWSLFNYTAVLFNKNSPFNATANLITTSATDDNINYYSDSRRYASSTSNLRAAYVTDNSTIFQKISNIKYIDLHIVGTAPLVVRSQYFSIGTISGHNGAVVIADSGVKLKFPQNSIILKKVDLRIFNGTMSEGSNVTVNKGGILSLFNPSIKNNVNSNIKPNVNGRKNGFLFFNFLTVNSGGILRFFNETNGIDGNNLILNNGSLVEIQKNVEIFTDLLNIQNSTFSQISSLKSYFSHTFLTDSNFTNSDFQYLNTSMVDVNLSINKNCYTKIISSLIINGVLINNYGTFELLNNSTILTHSEKIQNKIKNYNYDKISYLSIEKNGKLFVSSSNSLIVIPLLIKNGGILNIIKKSNLLIYGGGICENNCTINVTKSSKIIFEYNPFASLPYGKMIGDGSINIKSIFYPPLVLNSMISVQISALGVLTYQNKNISAITFHYLFNNLDNLKENILTNKMDFFINNITVTEGGKTKISNNINVNINNVILNSGSITINNNGTLFIFNSFNLLSGNIDGNGILIIEKTGFLNFLPVDSASSIISKINIINYGNINAYEKTINFIKSSTINNFGNIQFFGFQHWENNQILSSFESSFPINWENAPSGSIYENSNLIKCAEKCVNNQIISSTVGKAEILFENMIPCKSFLFNKKTKICQINSQVVSTSIYTPNVTYTWDVYNKNNLWLKAPTVINHENATFFAYPKERSSPLDNSININLDFKNYGIIKIAPKITVLFDYEFVQYQRGTSQIFGTFKTRKSSINGLIAGNGSIHFLDTNNTIITNNTVKSNLNFENHNLETSIISQELKVNIYTLININKNCKILSFNQLLIDNGILNILSNNLYLNVTKLNIKNNGTIQTKKTIITNRNDDYENCKNPSIIMLKPSYLSNFSSCYDLIINSTNITVSTGGTIYGSFSYVQTVFLSVDSNSSITSKGRGYSYQNIDLNTTSKYQFYGKMIFSSNFI